MVTICISKCTPIAGSIFVVSFIRYWTYRLVHHDFLSVVNFQNFASFTRSWHPEKKRLSKCVFVKHLLFPTFTKVKKLFFFIEIATYSSPSSELNPDILLFLSMLTAQKHKERATRSDKDSASKMSYKFFLIG